MGCQRLYPPICTIEGCDEAHICRGLCNKHYYRWRLDNGLARKETRRNRVYSPEALERRRAYNREYMRTHGHRGYDTHKEWRQANPEAWAVINRRARLKRRYGITPEDYDRMLADQGGCCAICRNECKTGRRLAVDHCHSTGIVRALLCSSCNQGLGNFGDDVERLKIAVEYIERFTNKETA